jgi:hypothetical protein
MPPTQRRSASFVPISPELNLDALVKSAQNFQYVERIHYDSISRDGLEAFEKLVLRHVVLGGKPLVVEGFQDLLDQELFSTQWLKDNVGSKCELTLQIASFYMLAGAFQLIQDSLS